MSEINRSGIDRRSGLDRRRKYSLGRLVYAGVERRGSDEQRSDLERRLGWVRIGKWSSAHLKNLTLAKFLIR